MATDVERLVVSLEARTASYEKALNRANAVTNQRMRQIEARTTKTHALLAKFGTGAFTGLTAGALGALAPILSIGAALNGAKAALDKFSAISDNAKSSGLDAEQFQELAYAAEQSGVEFDAFSKGLETFAKNSGLAAEGKGRMVTALKALNPELLKNIQAATTQDERVRLAADAIAKAGSASEKAALSTALFGEAGFKLADAFGAGAAGLDAMATKARSLGLIVDRDLIAKSEELGDQLSTATQVMDLQFKQALVDLAPILITTAQLAGNLASGIGYITDSMQALGQRTTSRLEQDFQGLSDLVKQNEAEFAPGVTNGAAMGVSLNADQLADTKAQMAAIKAELTNRAMAQLKLSLTQPKVTTTDDDGAGSGDAAASSAIKHGEAVRALIADLQFERDTIGETAQEQNILNTLRRAGVDASSAEGKAIRSLITDLDAQRQGIEANAQAIQEFNDLASNGLRSFIDDLIEGKSATEALGDALANIGSQLINAGLSNLFGGTGGAGGLFGDLFKIPGRASGGSVQAGQPYIVGEKRPELFVPSQSGVIVPRLPSSPTAGGSGVNVSFAPTITMTDGSPEGIARLERSMAKMQSEFDVRVKRIVSTRGHKW